MKLAMRPLFADRLGVTLMLVGLGGCGPIQSSMISYSSLRDGRDATFFVSGHTVVMQTRDPMGIVLVAGEPYLDQGRVVLTGALASAGGATLRTHCYDVSALPVRQGWVEQLVWRNPDGTLVAIRDVNRGLGAAELPKRCQALTRGDAP